MYWLYGIIVALIVLGVFYISIYNALIHLRQKVQEAWSGIEVQLKRRHDLIPALLDVVKAYANHERLLLEKVATERTQLAAGTSQTFGDRAQSEAALGEHLKSVIAVAEAYPDLKANQNFLNLQQQLSETEDQISAARRIYNANVSLFNTKIQSFPASLVAGLQRIVTCEFFGTEL